MHRSAHALYVSPDYTIVDGYRYKATPADAFNAGLAGLATRTAALFGSEGVVMLDAEAAIALGFTLDSQEVNNPALIAELGAAGWQCGALGRWSSLRAKDRPTVYVGLAPMIDPEWMPLWHEFPADLCGSLALWHELTGSAYHHSPGAAGLSMLINSTRYHTQWFSQVGPDRSRGGYELAWRADYWDRLSTHTAPFRHGYDKHSAGLAAATCTLLPRQALRHTGRREWQRNAAGWWCIERSPWNLDLMPDPAGPGKDDEAVIWVTSPRMALLQELAAEGVYAAPRIVDSYTAPATEVVKSWADKLSAATKRAQTLAADRAADGTPTALAQDAERVLTALRDAAGQTTGMLGSATSARAQRADWHYALVAMQGCSAWRTGWRVGKTAGVWPLAIDGDKLWYGADTADAIAACPPGLKLGVGVGQYHHEGTIPQ